jgi:hypothetical protein
VLGQDFADHEVLRCLEASVEEDRADQGLQDVRLHVGRRAEVLPLARDEQRSELQALGDRRERLAADQLGAAFAQLALILVLEPLVEEPAREHAEHGIAEKLEPFVARQALVVRRTRWQSALSSAAADS